MEAAVAASQEEPPAASLEDKLARRLLLVDEYDQVRQARARSAEPADGPAHPPPQARAPKPSWARSLDLAAAAHVNPDCSDRATTTSGDQHRSQRRASACPQTLAAATSGRRAGELAERGQLPRSRHHSLATQRLHWNHDDDALVARLATTAQSLDGSQPPQSPQPPPPLAAIKSGDGGGQSEAGTQLEEAEEATRVGERAVGVARLSDWRSRESNKEEKNRWARSHRRHSLQLVAGGLGLSGSGGCGGGCGLISDACCRALTEEELRGEREFNETLRRSLSRSPLPPPPPLSPLPAPLLAARQPPEVATSEAPALARKASASCCVGPDNSSGRIEAAQRSQRRRVSFTPLLHHHQHHQAPASSQQQPHHLERKLSLAATGSKKDHREDAESRATMDAARPQEVTIEPTTTTTDDQRHQVPTRQCLTQTEIFHEMPPTQSSDQPATQTLSGGGGGGHGNSGQQQAGSAPGVDNNRVQSIMANAKLRQEEFARLLEEHEQIVNEIARCETQMSSRPPTTTKEPPQSAPDQEAPTAQGGG